ncbi:glycosyltransferase family 2 protein [uncultured Rikenella sp.]|uniref:glycosyltransferase family 2 protein n=1 Tax=uncultured Rikenella sp. TaxID=368003 RepID=UPI00272D9961|nr:glycosyltransferase family 2 protein [uncultured Rikenella sp.]
MMKEYKVSVIVPCYNAEQFLTRCLDSLVNQTLEGIEIICVNDASPDNGIAILRDYEARYPNVVVIDLKENVRQGGARNRGIEIARGEYIGFVDADDWTASDMYEKLYIRAKETGADVIACGYDTIDSTGKQLCQDHPVNLGIGGPVTQSDLIIQSGSIWGKLIAKELLIQSGLRFPEQIFYEDNYFNAILGTLIQHYEVIPEPLYHYYVNTNSTTHKRNSPHISDRLKSLDLQLEYMQSNGLTLRYAPAIDYLIVRTIFNTVMMYLNTFDNPTLPFLEDLQKRLKDQPIQPGERNKYIKRLFTRREKFYLHFFRTSPYLFLMFYKIKQQFLH